MKYVRYMYIYSYRFLIESCYYWLGAQIYRQNVGSTSERWFYEPKPKWNWHDYNYRPSWYYLIDNNDLNS